MMATAASLIISADHDDVLLKSRPFPFVQVPFLSLCLSPAPFPLFCCQALQLVH
jgi:hypothetical protein